MEDPYIVYEHNERECSQGERNFDNGFEDGVNCDLHSFGYCYECKEAAAKMCDCVVQTKRFKECYRPDCRNSKKNLKQTKVISNPTNLHLGEQYDNLIIMFNPEINHVFPDEQYEFTNLYVAHIADIMKLLPCIKKCKKLHITEHIPELTEEIQTSLANIEILELSIYVKEGVLSEIFRSETIEKIYNECISDVDMEAMERNQILVEFNGFQSHMASHIIIRNQDQSRFAQVKPVVN